MMNLTNPTEKPSHKEIAACAYQIYVEEGRIPGREIDHWLRAEAKLLRERQVAHGGASLRDLAPAQDWSAGDGEKRKVNKPRSARPETSGASRNAR
jgi:hypothetical protein